MTKRNDKGYFRHATWAGTARRREWMRQWNRYLIPVLLAFVATGWSLEAQAAEPFHVCVNAAGLMKVVSTPDQCGKNETHHNLSPDATPEFLALQSRVASLEIQVAALQEEVAEISDSVALPKVYLPEGFSVEEGTSCTDYYGDHRCYNKYVALTLTLSKPVFYTVPVTIADDATGWAAVLEFAPSQTTATVNYPILRDDIPEADQEITISVVSTGVDIGVGETVIAVLNDDFPALLMYSQNYSTPETNDTAYLCVYARPYPGFELPMQVDYVIEDGSAENGLDFVATEAGTLALPLGGETACIAIELIDDTEVEPEYEYFTVRFTNPQNVTFGYNRDWIRVNIGDNDLVFEVTSELSVVEGNNERGPYTLMPVEITLNAPAPATQVFWYWASMVSNHSFDPLVHASVCRYPSNIIHCNTNNTIYPPYDVEYAGNTSVTIPAGGTTATAEIKIFGDTILEADETFSVVISARDWAVSPEGRSEQGYLATIIDDD